MISWTEFKASKSETKAFYIMGHKIIDTTIKHHDNKSIINVFKYGTHSIFCKSDFTSFSKSLFFDEIEALEFCKSKIQADLINPIDERLMYLRLMDSRFDKG